MVAAIVIGGIIGTTLAPWSGKVTHGLALGLVVAILAPIGDLCESMIKRDLGVKDLGTLLPGHGGVLDRFDAMLFCLPAVYYLAVQLKIG
jgi:phosphatidate cytidylyltransferase